MAVEPDSRDQKGNHYYRRKLLSRTFIRDDIMKLTFELPRDTSLQCLGFDIGLGDFIRIRPYSEEHSKLVENPGGGRAYSPVLLPDTKGKFSLIVKAYGPGGVSLLLKQVPVGSELLVASNVEHVFWKERQRGYYANERNADLAIRPPKPLCVNDRVEPTATADTTYGSNVCLIAFGIGITEVAPVAMSELLDPRVKKVTILWALKTWKDAEWLWEQGDDEHSDDLVHQLFAGQKRGIYGDRLQIKHILSQEERQDCLKGRITADILKSAFSITQVPNEALRFLAVGTTAMIAFAYESLGQLALDVKLKDTFWSGNNLLFRKLLQASHVSDRDRSPLIEHAAEVVDSERPMKKARM